MMSQRALGRLTELTALPDRTTARTAWVAEIIFEHQERVEALRQWAAPIDAPPRSVDEVMARLLQFPAVLITKDEDKALNQAGFRKSGAAEDRYSSVVIETTIATRSAADAFGVKPRRSESKGVD